MIGIFTLLYDVSYLPGALVLGIRLKQLLPESTTGILIDKSCFSQHQLDLISSLYDDIVEINPLVSEDSRLTLDLNRPTLNKTWSKIYLWSLLSYNKILFLDADTLPLISDSNITNILKIDFPQHKILASPDSGFPDIFNSGVFALKPNLHDYNQLLNLVKYGDDISFDGADQGLLNQYFNHQVDWVHDYIKKESLELTSGSENVGFPGTDGTSNWIRLPFLYNCTPSAQYQYLPGYNYFTRLVVPDISQGLTQPDSEIFRSMNETSTNYCFTALNYIKSNSQVKLLHYIGPIKPWNKEYDNGESGIFGPWWDVWHQHFPGKSISDVVYGCTQIKYTTDKDTQSEDKPEVQDEAADRHLDHHLENEKETTVDEEQPFEPSDLVNPINYQKFDTTDIETTDSTWDATREFPPTATTTTTKDFTDLEHGVHDFTNTWDLPEQPKAPSTEQSEEITVEDFDYPGIQFNEYVKPERVFDSGEDYYPVHKLKPVEKIALEEDATTSDHATLVTQVNTVNEKLTKLGIIESDDFEQIYDENEEDDEEDDADEEEGEENKEGNVSELDEENNQATYQPQVPKLFPWEFRPGHKPERTFDS
jgi:glycogenin glucosyltransferase